MLVYLNFSNRSKGIPLSINISSLSRFCRFWMPHSLFFSGLPARGGSTLWSLHRASSLAILPVIFVVDVSRISVRRRLLDLTACRCRVAHMPLCLTQRFFTDDREQGVRK